MAKRDKAIGKPAEQAVSPISGVAPPAEHRFKPGQSGNPKGRPSAGASIREWWNVMQDWPLDDVAGVMTDKKAPVSKVAAARAIVHACSEKLSKTGQPIAGGDLDRIIDHTAGKAVQAVEVSGPEKGPIETKGRVDYNAIEAEIDAIGKFVAGRAPADG